jgi:hypothetical protein
VIYTEAPERGMPDASVILPCNVCPFMESHSREAVTRSVSLR